MSLDARAQALDALKCECDPNALLTVTLHSIVKSSYPDMADLLVDADSDSDSDADSNSDSSISTGDEEATNVIKKLGKLNRNVRDSYADIIKKITPHTHERFEIIQADTTYSITRRSALFGLLLIEGITGFDPQLFLMGVLLTHPDQHIQQQLDKLSPLARYHLAKLLYKRYGSQINGSWHYYQQEANTIGAHSFASSVNELISHVGYHFANPWQDTELVIILQIIYPEYKARLLVKVWADIWLRPFQDSYSRRSFRLPTNDYTSTFNALMIMQNCSHYPHQGHYEGHQYVTSYYDVNLTQSIQFQDDFGYRSGFHPYLLAAALDIRGDVAPKTSVQANAIVQNQAESRAEIFAVCHNIIHQQDAYGRVSQPLIKGLLSANDPKAWQLIADLLISAQRQEGLRQTIIESLDEAHPDAIPFIIALILEHDLTRFSSVVRGFDVWTGLPWEAQRASTVKQFLQFAQQVFAVAFNQSPELSPELSPDQNQLLINTAQPLSHEQLALRLERLHSAMPAWLASQNHGHIYMALWVLGCYDVAQMLTYLAKMAKDKSADKACLASLLLEQIALPEHSLPLLYELCFREDEKVLAYATSYLSRIAGEQYDYHLSQTQQRTLFERCQQLLDTHKNSKSSFEKGYVNTLFAGISAHFSSQNLHQIMIEIAVINVDLLPKILEKIDSLPLTLRERLTRLMLPNYSPYYYYGDGGRGDMTPSTEQKQFALMVLSDRAESIQNIATTALLAAEVLSVDDSAHLLSLLAKKSTRLKKSILQILLNQPKASLQSCVKTLLLSQDSQQRVAGLELWWHLFDHDDFATDELDLWLTEYQQHLNNTLKAKPIKAEQEQLARCQLKADDSKQVVLSVANGWGLYDANNLHASDLPVLDADNIYLTLNKISKSKIASIVNRLPLKNKLDAPIATRFSKPIEHINADLEQLHQLFLSHQYHEYSYESYDGSKEVGILGNGFHRIAHNIDSTDIFNTEDCAEITDSQQRQLDRRHFENYPLHEVWEQWYQDSGWQTNDLFLLELTDSVTKIVTQHSFFAPFFSPLFCCDELVIPTVNPLSNSYYAHNLLSSVLSQLRLAFPFSQKNDYLIGLTTQFFAALPDNLRTRNFKENPIAKNRHFYGLSNEVEGWQREVNFSKFLNEITYDNLAALSAKQVKSIWQLWRWRQYAGLTQDIAHLQPTLEIAGLAYQQGLINTDEMMAILLNNRDNLHYIQYYHANSSRYKAYDWISRFPFLLHFAERIIAQILSVELMRDDLETSMSNFAKKILRIDNSDNIDSIATVVTLLQSLAKTGFHATAIYGYNDSELSKKAMFSKLVKACYPVHSQATDLLMNSPITMLAHKQAPSQTERDDWQVRFNHAMEQAGFDDEWLIALAMYARQWQPLVDNYLQWDGLDSGICWMIAHTKVSGYQEQNADDESAVARYSTLELAEFQRGAVDIDWFKESFHRLGRKRWEILYDCAKYISEGNGHRRAKLYSDVLTGDLKIRTVSSKVKDKRDQDYVRLYGLVPLSKTNPSKDILARYQTLMQFKKDSRQFGSQRQLSEGQAVDVALENLARNAGFTDPQRLTWAMETQAVQEILAGETTFNDGDLSISLRVDGSGKTHLDVQRDGKALKTIPAKYKKDKALQILKDHKKTLIEQFKRARHSLEMAMVRGDAFTVKELATLFQHPVIGCHLTNLVFITEKMVVDDNSESNTDQAATAIGFYQSVLSEDNPELQSAHLISATQQRFELLNTNHIEDVNIRLRIAHCVDLQQAKVWSDYQRHCFEQHIIQPFKQIFRELYVPTPDELEAKSVSRRYAGHQVQPAKTVALLKSRGWRADYEEGLQKVNHSLGFRVKMYALADWFSPADSEAPTLETVVFEDLRTGKPIDFCDIEPRAFSEAMRDLDLVVSVAHVGDIDVSTSQSSMALRSVLVSESMRLFKQDNVELKERHALIKGTMGEYSVHLGSAVVHQIGGSYLSILPVHSQHRGRVFLPFLDEDPKTAELISKVLLLARDDKIQDPTILRQIS